MLDILKRFFNPKAVGDDNKKEVPNEHDLRVATCALLLEMGRIDETFTPKELAALLEILKNKYGLAREQADALIEAADAELNTSVDYWQFARLINENYSVTEKVELIETLWQIVFVDGKMDKYENYLMHKLAKLLRLSHDQLITAKLKVLHPAENKSQ
jgi:uncharacterized tellurite resistance protein B-like protein